jgi:hypothetical protein
MLHEPRADGFFAVGGLGIDQDGIREEDLALTRADDQDAQSLSGAWLRRKARLERRIVRRPLASPIAGQSR